MCGFAGFLDYRGRGDQALVDTMAATLYHRGPDDSGAEFFHCGDVSIGLGFRRLAIIDLSPAGHQPMSDPSGRNWIMLNGEVYNYREIRTQLEQSGIRFRSNSDTEVVLQAWLTWGPACLDRFIGMFAFVIVEPEKELVTLVRDRAGVKPLFYHVHSNGVLFASELKAFHKHPDFVREIDANGLGLYFRHGNIPAPYTIFARTFKVAPGEYIQFDLKSRATNKKTYWNLLDSVNRPNNVISYNEAIEETTKLMESAFAYRMVADVPVGVFLSGGYDSTAVAALLSHSGISLNTYTIGFEESEFDESLYAEKVAAHLGTKHETYRCTLDEAKSIIPNLPDIFDEPFGDSSAVPTTLVSKIARQHVTVALSADAGDELFAGYPRHIRASRLLSKRELIPAAIRNWMASGVNFLPGQQHSIGLPDRKNRLVRFLRAKGPVEAFDILNQTFSPDEIRGLASLVGQNQSDSPVQDALFGDDVELLNKVLASEYRAYLVDDILQKVDRASMSVSLEGREPFLDHRLAEWAMQLPVSFKLKDGVSKRILKDIVHAHVPRELMERPKMGFGIPLKSWMASDLKDVLMNVMGDDALKSQALVDPVQAKLLRDDYLNGQLGDFERLWFVFTLLQWNQRWM